MCDHKIEEGMNCWLEKFDSKTKAKARMVAVGPRTGKHILLLLDFWFFICFCCRRTWVALKTPVRWEVGAQMWEGRRMWQRSVAGAGLENRGMEWTGGWEWALPEEEWCHDPGNCWGVADRGWLEGEMDGNLRISVDSKQESERWGITWVEHCCGPSSVSRDSEALVSVLVKWL